MSNVEKGWVIRSDASEIRTDKYEKILEYWEEGWKGGDFGDIMDELTGLHMGEKPLSQYEDDELDAVYKQALKEQE